MAEHHKKINKFLSLDIGVRGIFFVLILVSLLSFLAYLYSGLNSLFFGIIVLATLIISLKKPSFGLYVAFLELFVGSKGHLVYFDLGGFVLSLRMGIFITIFLVWAIRFLIDYFKKYKENKKLLQLPEGYFSIFKTKFAKYYLLLGVVVAWGGLWGALKNNGVDIFFDFNNWLYFLIIIPAFDFIKTKAQLKIILNCLMAGTIFLAFKTLCLLYIYSHAFETWTILFFRWMTDFGIGEISAYLMGFYRVFIQSQIFAVFAFFISLITILISKYSLKEKPKAYLWLVLLSASITLLVSFSRSYWVGLLLGILVLFYALKIKLKFSWLEIFKSFVVLFATAVVSLAVVYAVLNLPPKVYDIDLAAVLSSRLSQNEAAGQSRISQLEPLGLEIAKHPVIGHGFGKNITYQSFDPRIMTPRNPDGWYTTYAFEWGYLDMILKFGIFGLLVYLVFICHLLKVAWQKFKIFLNTDRLSSAGIVLAGIVGVVGLLAVHMFSPYLNHPLGIGYLILFNLIILII